VPLVDWLNETLTLVPIGAADTADLQGGFTRSLAPGGGFQVQGKIEARSGQGRRLVTDAADVPISTHLATLPPAIYDAAGAVTRDLWALFKPAGSGAVDWHVLDTQQGDYIVVAPARAAKTRTGIHHIELELQVVGGGM